MRLILCDVDAEARAGLAPLALSRPIWQLRSGMTTLGRRLAAHLGSADVAGFVPAHLAPAAAHDGDWPVNDPGTLSGDDLLIVDARLKPAGLDITFDGSSEIAHDSEGRFVYARIARDDLARLETDSLEALLASAGAALPAVCKDPPRWRHAWELMSDNAEQITADFHAVGRSGVASSGEPPILVGDERDVYVAPDATIGPRVVVDVSNGPVYVDSAAEIQPFTHIAGPCYVGAGSVLLGAKCRGGTTVGPQCRVGGEVEQVIFQGHANKYHDGFLGHAVVGAWVNLGAGTTNSDLRNDYAPVRVCLDGHTLVETGCLKVGALIGDHCRSSIGTLLNTGTCVGPMTMLVGGGGLLPRFVPAFSVCAGSEIAETFSRRRFYDIAARALPRRGQQWTEADERMWDAIYEQTAEQRAYST
ncbi:MAG: hypothetical protein KGY99_05220 [Phycisphaerae bacterium]|nr:hypothetical protein [Phycisphaerae bacterium]